MHEVVNEVTASGGLTMGTLMELLRALEAAASKKLESSELQKRIEAQEGLSSAAQSAQALAEALRGTGLGSNADTLDTVADAIIEERGCELQKALKLNKAIKAKPQP